MHPSHTIFGLALLAGCVHTDVQRTGRQRLGDGAEGRAPIEAAVSADYDEAAVIAVEADAAGSIERRERHLQRRASLLGCDAVVRVRHEAHTTTGVCVRRREPAPAAVDVAYLVAEPTPKLLARARAGGPDGEALLGVLSQVERRPEAEKSWPLRWYLRTYPNSPFRAEVEAMFVATAPPGAPASILTAPTTK